MIDLHSHVLYGVDDGARDKNESIAMLKAARKCGFRVLYATPHYRAMWKNTNAAKKAFFDLKPEAAHLGIKLCRGAELYTGSFDRDMLNWYLVELAYDSSRCILFELKTSSLVSDEEERIYLLQRAGMDVLIAHPERYTEIQRSKQAMRRYFDIGCRLLISADDLLLPFWRIRRITAERILNSGFPVCIASDAHSADDYLRLRELLKKRPDLKRCFQGVEFDH